METNAGSTLLPVIKIINNTTKELTNVVLSYEGLNDSSIQISKLNTNSEIITTISTSFVKDTVNLILSYDHDNIHEEKIVYPNFTANSLIKLTLEISDVNGEHNIVSIIEKDPVDNPIELMKAEKTNTHKFIIISGIATLSALCLYTIQKNKNSKWKYLMTAIIVEHYAKNFFSAIISITISPKKFFYFNYAIFLLSPNLESTLNIDIDNLLYNINVPIHTINAFIPLNGISPTKTYFVKSTSIP